MSLCNCGIDLDRRLFVLPARGALSNSGGGGNGGLGDVGRGGVRSFCFINTVGKEAVRFVAFGVLRCFFSTCGSDDGRSTRYAFFSSSFTFSIETLRPLGDVVVGGGETCIGSSFGILLLLTGIDTSSSSSTAFNLFRSVSFVVSTICSFNSVVTDDTDDFLFDEGSPSSEIELFLLASSPLSRK